MTFDEAKKFLEQADYSSLADHTFGDTEFGWTLDGKYIADGYHSSRRDTCRVTIFGADTRFEGNEAKLLMGVGKTRHYARNDGEP